MISIKNHRILIHHIWGVEIPANFSSSNLSNKTLVSPMSEQKFYCDDAIELLKDIRRHQLIDVFNVITNFLSRLFHFEESEISNFGKRIFFEFIFLTYRNQSDEKLLMK
jgi:hypothetical protein